MVHAWSCSFQRTIIGLLWRSLWWWPPHHCSVPPLPPATFVRLILDLCRNSSSTLIPPTIIILIIAITNQHHALSTAAQPEPHHAPHMFHVLGQSYHTHTNSRGHGFWSPQGLSRIWVSTLQHPSEYKSFVICSILQPYVLLNISLYAYVFICINTQAVVCNLPVQIST